MENSNNSTKDKRMIWIADEHVSRLMHIYLGDMDDGIDGHIEAIDAIRVAPEADTIVIHITSFGGATCIADNYIEAIRDSRAHIVTKAIGTVASAGTMVWLAGHERVAADFSKFLFHNIRGGGFEDIHNLKRYIDASAEYAGGGYRDMYRDILTEKEIEEIFSGQEVHILGQEMQKRLAKIESAKKEGSKAEPVGPVTTPPLDEPVGKVDEATVFTITLDDGYGKTFNLYTINEKDFDEYNMDELEEVAEAFCLPDGGYTSNRSVFIGNIISFLTTGEV